MLAGPVREAARYAQAALAGEVDKVLAAQIGARNDTLNRSAFALGQLVGAGALERHEAERQLARAARRVGLGAVEAARTIHSGLTAGMRRPRRPAA